MQLPHLQLKEIIWEITGRCNNGCSYCGSKDQWGTEVDHEKILKIAKAIQEFALIHPGIQIDISGGDPLVVPYDIHKKIYDLLNISTRLKILVNPKSLVNSRETYNEILNLYTWIGVSINTQEEIDCLELENPRIKSRSNITYITNFNTSNVFLFDKLAKAVGNNPWVIQFTMYKDEKEAQALYYNDEAREYLEEKIRSAHNYNKIMIADNANDNPCPAGLHSLGILADGTVVPCLSMRSWLGDLQSSHGFYNISKEETTLLDLWRNGFKIQRFYGFKCCKDHCNLKKINKLPQRQLISSPSILDDWKRDPITPFWPGDSRWPTITAYAVFNPFEPIYANSVPVLTTTGSSAVTVDAFFFFREYGD